MPISVLQKTLRLALPVILTITILSPARGNNKGLHPESQRYIDSVIQDEMKNLHIPGAVLSIVKDGEVVYKNGYGFVDMKNRKPADPDTTLFFVGSVSKLVTATAAMQLYEQGKLDLQRNVNDYLEDVSIDNNFKKPVTPFHLLTHTAGFEERTTNMIASKQENLISLKEYLASGKQPRVEQPGKYLSYSNYGMTLLGYLVQEISGMPFSEYVDENILTPLEMEKSSFVLTPGMKNNLARAYSYSNGKFEEMPIVYLHVKPAGSLLSTAEEMAHFMIAHLQNGKYEDTRILERTTAVTMHSRQFTHHEKLAGWCYGFYERFHGDYRIIEHAGDIAGFASLCALIPDHDFGLFISNNGGEGISMFKFRERVLTRILNRFYPTIPAVPVKPDITGEQDMSRYDGVYRVNRYSRLSFEKMSALLFTATIDSDERGYLTFNYPPVLKEEPTRWAMVEPLLFRRVDTDEYMAFMEDSRGRIIHMNTRYMTPLNFERAPCYDSLAFQSVLIGIMVVLFITAVLGWPTLVLVRRLKKSSYRSSGPEKSARIVIGAASFLNTLFIVGFSAIVSVAFMGSLASTDTIITFFLTLPIIAAILTLAGMVFAWLSWKRGFWFLFGRIHYSAVVAANLVFIWFTWHWILLGYHL